MSDPKSLQMSNISTVIDMDYSAEFLKLSVFVDKKPGVTEKYSKDLKDKIVESLTSAGILISFASRSNSDRELVLSQMKKMYQEENCRPLTEKDNTFIASNFGEFDIKLTDKQLEEIFAVLTPAQIASMKKKLTTPEFFWF